MEAPERSLPPVDVRKTNSVMTTATASTFFSERHPYLDLIATSQHLPERSLKNEQWRYTLIQPVCIPSLSRTGIKSMFDQDNEPVMRPDGLMSGDFKESIHKHMYALPKLPMYVDDRDVKRRDRDRTCEKAVASNRRTPNLTTQSGTQPPQSAPVACPTTDKEDSHPGQHSDVMTASLGTKTRVVDQSHRLQRPYSDPTLFRSLMDFHYHKPNQPYQWEVKGLTYVLHT